MITDEGKEVDVRTLEEEEDKEATPLSIEEIDNVSMVKSNDAEVEEDFDDEEEDDYEAEIEDELDDMDDAALMEGDEE